MLAHNSREGDTQVSFYVWECASTKRSGSTVLDINSTLYFFINLNETDASSGGNI